MSKRYGCVCLFCMLLLMMMMASAAAEAPPYVPLPKLRQQAEAGLQGDYQVKGLRITYSLQPQVPQAERCPALRVRLPGDLSRLIPVDARDRSLPLEKQVETSFERDSSSGLIYPPENQPYPSANQRYPLGSQAENNPMTWQEAEAFLMDSLAPMLAATGPYQLMEGDSHATSRMYRNTATGLYRWDFPELDLSTPTTPMGYYQLSYLQAFHGIPLLGTGTYRVPDQAVGELARPRAQVQAVIAGQQDYMIRFAPAAWDSLLAEDLPLAAFDRVAREVARVVQAGYAYQLSGLRFGSLLMDDPENPGKTFILLPVWQLQGRFVNDPNQPFPDLSSDEQAFLRRSGAWQARYINAQTAQYMDPEDQARGRNLARLIWWEGQP